VSETTQNKYEFRFMIIAYYLVVDVVLKISNELLDNENNFCGR